jgi:hypothetical protein
MAACWMNTFHAINLKGAMFFQQYATFKKYSFIIAAQA